MLTYLFGPKASSTKDQILHLMDLRHKSPSGFKGKEISLKLKSLCLRNPSIVAEIIFSDIDEVDKDRLLFIYSTDHWGSCRSIDNPRWSEMMRRFIIPYSDQLSKDIQRTIKWYQNTHNL